MYGEPVDLKPVDLLKVLVDPEDPVQTVENFFDFAFLIKVRTYVHRRAHTYTRSLAR
jgi:hypothetical protein